MKTLLMTGAHGDIGRAITDLFERHDYVVIAPMRDTLNLHDLSQVEGYVATLPRIHAFIHCAGINYPKPFVDIEENDLQQTMTVNTFSFYKITQALVRQQKLMDSGHVLAMSSIYGEVSRKGRFSYTASKSCLNGMVKALAIELGQCKIKVNGLAPGFVDTRLTRQNNSPDVIAHFEKVIPLGHLAQVNDIAKIAYFLSSEANNYITGQVIIADGGYLAGGFQE